MTLRDRLAALFARFRVVPGADFSVHVLGVICLVVVATALQHAFGLDRYKLPIDAALCLGVGVLFYRLGRAGTYGPRE